MCNYGCVAEYYRSQFEDEDRAAEIAERNALEREEKKAMNKLIEASIRYHNITHDDMNNGDGLRTVLWVAGCNHKCKNCQNPDTWDCCGGLPFTDEAREELFLSLSNPWISGVTFSGGDPLHPNNRKFIGQLMKECKDLFPEKDIWLYTGYSLKQTENGFVFEDDVIGESFAYEDLKYIDVLIDGRFDMDVRKADLETNKAVLWRGSSNQKIIDVKKTLEAKVIIEREV